MPSPFCKENSAGVPTTSPPLSRLPVLATKIVPVTLQINVGVPLMAYSLISPWTRNPLEPQQVAALHQRQHLWLVMTLVSFGLLEPLSFFVDPNPSR